MISSDLAQSDRQTKGLENFAVWSLLIIDRLMIGQSKGSENLCKDHCQLEWHIKFNSTSIKFVPFLQ